MEDNSLQKSLQLLESISKGDTPSRLEAIALEALQIVKAEKGFIRSYFIIPSQASDSDGNWHAGAIATIIDCVGGSAVSSVAGIPQVSLDFTISYYSTAKIGEEIEIEAKVAGTMGRLSTVMVEVRKKHNQQLVALGKQWTSANSSKWPNFKLGKL